MDTTVYDLQALPPFVLDYQFLKDHDESTDLDLQNGLTLNDTYIPEEVMLQILSYVEPKQVLQCSLVCRKWNRLIKSFPYWSSVYKRHYKQRKPKKLPWYVYYCLFSTDYFDTNLIKKGKRETEINEVESRCIGGSYTTCWKYTVSLQENKLFSHIVNCYKPHIYLSERTGSLFNSSYIYKLSCIFRKENCDIDIPNPPCTVDHVDVCPDIDLKKMELTIKEYPEQVDEISFMHDGRYMGLFVTSYIPTMAGAVMKFLFDTIEPLPIENNKIIAKKFSKSEYTSNGLSNPRKQDIQCWFAWLRYGGVDSAQ